MKKILLSLLVIVLLTGCSMPNITRVDKYEFEQTMYTILPLNIKMHNKISKGYKYYAPKGIQRINSKNNNEVLKSINGTYYLYVDVVNYYYKAKNNYKVKNNAYYSDKLNYNNKNGYLEITRKNKKLFVQMYYNYAKIETYTTKEDLNDCIRNSSYILSSIDFNDSLLKKMYEAGTLGSKEEVYSLFKDKEKKGNFLEYIEEYDKYEDDGTNDNNGVEVKTTTTKKSE